jgi:hypothetical protein
MITVEEIDKLAKEFNLNKLDLSKTIILSSKQIQHITGFDVEIFDFRFEDNEWDIYSHISNINVDGIYTYNVVFGEDNAYEFCRNAYFQFIKKYKEHKIEKKINKAQEDFK